MGYCKDCAYGRKEPTTMQGVGFWYCVNRVDRRGHYVKVDSKGSCSQFTPRDDGSYRNEGCFLTSACVDYLGKSDDCKELTALRYFRDGYMKSTEDGKNLVDEYYSIAPKIVEKINESDKKEKYYDYIYAIVKECAELIEIGGNEQTLDKYKNMVEYFKKEFSL